MRKMPRKRFRCERCGKVFEDLPEAKRKYCSNECRNKTRRGEPRQAFQKETICWTCKNTNDSCPWFSANPKPVEGWTAERKDYRQSNGELCDTYIVKECPNYEKAR